MIYFPKKAIEDIMKIVPILLNALWKRHVKVEFILNINQLYFILEIAKKDIMALFVIFAWIAMEKLIKINVKNVQISNNLYLQELKSF